MNEQEEKISRFDLRGIAFFTVWLISAVLLFVAVHSGSRLLGDYLIRDGLKADEQRAVAAREQLAEIYALRAERSNELAESRRNPRQISGFDLKADLPPAGKAVAADLASMKVGIYEDGSLVAEYPIISKGKDGSRWQTPVGSYSIETKERSHFSSIGEVYMPYSMQFYGNFYIHGWPYYQNGQPVRMGYTGGCIRLSTEDAKKIYEFADRGTPIFVYENPSGEMPKHSIAASADVPSVSAKSYLVANIDTGEVFAEENASEIRPIASLTKLVTAVVANEAITYDRPIPIADHAVSTPGEKLFRKGEVLTATELLYPLLMQSDNGAAIALADSFGSYRFIELMNDKVEAIGMTASHFADSSGISENNTSNAEDLFRLARYMNRNQKYILDITRIPEINMPPSPLRHPAYTLKNFNEFSDKPQFLGGKSGKTTAAAETMLALFSYHDGDDRASTTALAVIVLGSDNRKQDVSTLYNWTLASLTRAPSIAVDKPAP
ncbi:MAG: hypothetical protein QOG91_665 [Candidatus Parcubacteria bacterium]|jgi:D-alanyl-D-alanine carboxypeptidase|nr:hypothetical protein [Candidatus Parcubacteria bacterium]